ncbi:MAG: DEAD/DEAH box helicase [Planktothrix sp.]
MKIAKCTAEITIIRAMIKTRPYQEKSIDLIYKCFAKGHKHIILCAPTGSGKTITFSEIARRTLEEDLFAKVLILTDRIELMTQSGSTLYRAGLEPSLIIAGKSSYTSRSRAIVGMVETFYRRLQKGWQIPNLKLIIIDEAHKGNFKKIIAHFQDKEVKIIGATATPLSQSKKDPLKNYYSDIVVATDIPELIELGYLASPTYFAVKASITAKVGIDGDYKSNEMFLDYDKPKMYDGVVLNYQRHALGKKTLIFCVNIEHAQKTTKAFAAENIKAQVLTSLDDSNVRKEILKWFARTDNAVLINCGILTTGFDEPTIECIILNRATKSLPLYLQMVGRAARVTAQKIRFIIIDMGNNLDTHKAWEKRRDWRTIFLNPEKWREKTNQETIEDTKECPTCQAISQISKKICANCGYEFSTTTVTPFGLTEEIKPEDFSYLFDFDLNKMSVVQLIKRADLGNKRTGQAYKKGWIIHHLKERDNPEYWLTEYAKAMNYKMAWVKYQLEDLKQVI